jgi:hypothetical protein
MDDRTFRSGQRIPRSTIFLVRWILVLFSALSAPAQAVAPPDTPAGHALASWLEAFNSADEARMKAYTQRYQPTVPVGLQMSFRQQTGGLDLTDIRRHQRHGDYNSITQGDEFANLLTTHLREVGHDKHLGVRFVPTRLPDNLDAPPDAQQLARNQRMIQRSNCAFDKAEVLPNNIGYVKFNGFYSPATAPRRRSRRWASFQTPMR